MIKKLVYILKDGLFHILTGSFFGKFIGFLSSIFVIRYLPVKEYGIYVSASNFYSYITVFIGMGFSGAILQYCSEIRSQGQKNDLCCYAIKKGTVFNFILCIIILLYSIFGNTSEEKERVYLGCLAFLPFISYICDFFQVQLRVHNLNKEYSYVGGMSAILTFVSNLILSRIIGVLALIITPYIVNLLTFYISTWFLKKRNMLDINFASYKILPYEIKREFATYSLGISFTNFTSVMLTLLDVTCLGLVLGDMEILAEYKVATAIPTAMLFIPDAFIVYYYPKLVSLYNSDIKMFVKEVKFAQVILLIISFFISFLMFNLSDFIIIAVYGEKYSDSAIIFRILCINYFVYCSFRKFYGNLIAMIRKIKVNFINTLLSGIINIILNLFLIEKMGSMGAAVATLIVSGFTTCISMGYLKFHLKRFYADKTLNL